MNRLFVSLTILFTMTVISGCSTVYLGFKKYEEGDNDGAKPILQKACEQNDRAACYALSNILKDEHNYKGSLTYLEKSCALDNLRACSVLAGNYLMLDRAKEAKAILDKSNNINLEASYQKSNLLKAEKKYAERKKLLTEICSKPDRLACELLGDLAYDENDIKTAKKFYMQIESSTDLSLMLGVIEKRLGNHKQAEIEINKACSLDRGLACRIKALSELEKNNSSFEKSYTAKCAQLDGKACYNLGLHFSLTNNQDLSKTFFEKACKAGDGNGCLEKYNNSRDTSSSSELIKILQESCDKGSGSGCEALYTLSNEYYDISPSILEKGCTFGKGNACLLMANIHWKNKNKDDAFKMYNNACQLGFQTGCFYLEFLDKNENTQEIVAQKYCNQKIDEACHKLGQLYNSQENFPSALKAYQQSCVLKNLYSCSLAIELQGKVDKNFNQITAYSKLCNNSYSKACLFAADLLIDNNKKEEAKKLFERACNADYASGCNNLGWIYSNEKNTEKAKYYYRQGCDLGSSYGCDKITEK